MCRGGGSRAQGQVRAVVVPTTPRSLERVRREMSHLLVVFCRPGYFLNRKKTEIEIRVPLRFPVRRTRGV